MKISFVPVDGPALPAGPGRPALPLGGSRSRPRRAARHRHRQRLRRPGRRGAPELQGLARARCWKSSTSPAAAPACGSRTASPSTPGRPSSPRPSCSRSCGRCAAGASPTTSRWCRCDPFYRIRYDDGTHFDYSNDPDRDARRRSAASARRDLAGYERFVAEAETLLPPGFREARRHGLRQRRRPAACQPQPDAHARLAQPVCAGGQPHAAPEAAHRLQPAVAADRRQPLQRHLHLQPDQRAGAALRRALGDGRHRGAGARPGGAARSSAACRCAATPRSGASWSTAAAPPASSWPTASGWRPTSWSAMPTPPGPTATWSSRSTGRTGPTGASSARSIR